MTRWLQAANAARNPTDLTDKTDKTSPSSMPQVLTESQSEVLSVLSVLSIDEHASSATTKTRSSLGVRAQFPQGQSAPDQPRTWTGRIVSLDEWRGMSAWERHGPNGRVFCGITRRWIDADET